MRMYDIIVIIDNYFSVIYFVNSEKNTYGDLILEQLRDSNICS